MLASDGLGCGPEILTFINIIVGDSETTDGQLLHEMGINREKVLISVV